MAVYGENRVDRSFVHHTFPARENDGENMKNTRADSSSFDN